MSAARCFCGRTAPEAGRPCKLHDTAARPERPAASWSKPEPRASVAPARPVALVDIPPPTLAQIERTLRRPVRLADAARAPSLAAVPDEAPRVEPPRELGADVGAAVETIAREVAVRSAAPGIALPAPGEGAPLASALCAWYRGCLLPANNSPGMHHRHARFCRKHQHTVQAAERRQALKGGPAAGAAVADAPMRPPCARAGCEGVAGPVRRNTNPADAPYCLADRQRRQQARGNGYDPDSLPPTRAPVEPAPTQSPRASSRTDGDVPLKELIDAHAIVRALGGLAALRKAGVGKLARVVAALAGDA